MGNDLVKASGLGCSCATGGPLSSQLPAQVRCEDHEFPGMNELRSLRPSPQDWISWVIVFHCAQKKWWRKQSKRQGENCQDLSVCFGSNDAIPLGLVPGLIESGSPLSRAQYHSSFFTAALFPLKKKLACDAINEPWFPANVSGFLQKPQFKSSLRCKRVPLQPHRTLAVSLYRAATPLTQVIFIKIKQFVCLCKIEYYAPVFCKQNWQRGRGIKEPVPL